MLAVLELVSWLTGFTPVAATDRPTHDATVLLTSVAIDDDPACGPAHPGFALGVGDEVVVASHTRGTVVLAGDGQVVAWSGNFACDDGADIAMLAVGDAQIGAPVIAIVTRRRSTTALWLAQVHGAHIDTLFAGDVVRSDGAGLHVGRVDLVSGGLVYVDPAGVQTRMIFDGERYVREPLRSAAR
jgi:hypothetical protein